VAPPKVDPSDPWYGTTPGAVEPEVKALALVEPKLTPETYRAESAAAVARLPATTRFVFSAQLAELRAQSQVAAILDTAAKKPQLAMVAALLPPCVKAMVSDAEWIVFGSGSLDTSQDGTLVMRGRWRRDDVMSCLGETKPHVAHDGAKLYRISDDFWLDFIDVHTAYVTRQTGMDADHVHELVRHGAGPSAHARELLAQLPADRSLAFVLDGKAGTEVIEKSLGLPNTTDLAGWIRLEKSGAALDIAVDPHDAAIAHDTLVRARAELGKLFGEAKETAVGKLEVVLDKTAVHVRGTMTGLMLALISSGLSAL
jgi:hypothetical protein